MKPMVAQPRCCWYRLHHDNGGLAADTGDSYVAQQKPIKNAYIFLLTETIAWRDTMVAQSF
jgi:hypothetical protein